MGAIVPVSLCACACACACECVSVSVSMSICMCVCICVGAVVSLLAGRRRRHGGHCGGLSAARPERRGLISRVPSATATVSWLAFGRTSRPG